MSMAALQESTILKRDSPSSAYILRPTVPPSDPLSDRDKFLCVAEKYDEDSGETFWDACNGTLSDCEEYAQIYMADTGAGWTTIYITRVISLYDAKHPK